MFPESFIDIAETGNLIHSMGERVLALALESVVAQHSQSGRMRVAVNVSVRQLLHQGFTRQVFDDLALYGVSRADLIIEVIEWVVIDEARGAIVSTVIHVALGCDHLQGYYFARPLPAAEFQHLTYTVISPSRPNNRMHPRSAWLFSILGNGFEHRGRQSWK